MSEPREMQRFRGEFPLGEAWSELDRFEDTVTIAGVSIGRAGLVARNGSGREMTGSAAEVDSTPAAAMRAYCELVERVSTVEALEDGARSWPVVASDGAVTGYIETRAIFPESDEPEVWQYARSNGIAFHTDFEQARDRATWELIERDRVLRSWYGPIPPERTELPGAFPEALRSVLDWQAYVLPDPDPAAWAADVRVAVVVGFPRSADVPLALGFGARPRAEAALGAAAGEAFQRLAFLWDESIPRDRPDPAPNPQSHLEWFLYPEHHGLLRSWLDGRHRRFGQDWPGSRAGAGAPSFVDLTPAALRGRGHVIQARCPDVIPLTFGVGPRELSGHLPEALKMHPVA
ncbi:MAG: YcaO-like family protein [Myxococcota bacterium]